MQWKEFDGIDGIDAILPQINSVLFLNVDLFKFYAFLRI